ncbi:KdsC family phosphatase [Marinobacterium mangrovicola]|uniref:3-deoxy-D-manno-octulosonate 8-phosphate phosphatase KdsC n=1 Tax=Marinobacterium mangrovicola TaxID=1476959 RepID=A0A4R1GJB0_9GAMM|nr:HAD hydrolase family protein [Marinobacterium mangrovicola]TCK07311.1 3-deoxy-D-manno-octulosonate 8-phosphate phosphatase (KDO 8-P phosphatase) [Marinobacterium mangrovicola]
MLDNLSTEQLAKLKKIGLVVFDVDGILNSGQLNFLADGREIKSFSILDGLGIKLLHKGGIKSAIITGRRSPQVELRAEALGINYLRQGREDKRIALEELWQETGFDAASTAYIGDDLPDLGAIRAAGFGATVPNGHWYVRQHADWVSSTPGGQGAGREICELILAAQEKLTPILEEYL